MSTRAIITVKSADGKEVQRLYAHGDGYPSQVGLLVYNFSKIAKSMDQNAGGKIGKAAFGHTDKKTGKYVEGRYHQMPGVGRAYATMANVTVEPDKFVPALISYMTNKGYGGLYLTDRDPVKEAAAKGHGEKFGTDIEWHYVVTLGKDYGGIPKVETYESVMYGPKKPLYQDEKGKIHTTGSLQHFVKRASMPMLVAKGAAERKAYTAKWEKEEAEKKLNSGVGYGSSSVSSGGKRKTTRKSYPKAGTKVYIAGLRGLK